MHFNYLAVLVAALSSLPARRFTYSRMLFGPDVATRRRRYAREEGWPSRESVWPELSVCAGRRDCVRAADTNAGERDGLRGRRGCVSARGSSAASFGINYQFANRRRRAAGSSMPGISTLQFGIYGVILGAE